MKIAIALNSVWNLVNFRAGLINALVDAGHEVIAVAPPDEYVSQLVKLRCRYLPLPMDVQGTHPGRDFLFMIRIYRLLLSERPDVLLSYTIKLNIFGSIAAHTLRIPVVNNISGLGAVFITNSWLTKLVERLYRIALSRSFKVFFQNGDDQRLFVDSGLIREGVADRIPGSGVDLNKFRMQEVSPYEGESSFRFLLVARMLWDKGVGEYVEAARILKKSFPKIECCLLGFIDVENPAAISRLKMDEWIAEGVVIYLGSSEDVRVHIANADCVVLPSYREGIPRVLLESAAMGKPILAADSVGCREVVESGVNGYLCKVRDSSDLASKMGRMAQLSVNERQKMGLQGRKKIEREFDEKIVIDRYMQVIKEIQDK